MKKSQYFEKELELIQSEDLKEFTRYYLDNYVPSYFWEIGASSSGKFHPSFAQGKGGLVRHTKAVVMFADELLRMSSYAYMKDEFKDYVIMACIVHDTCKYGMNEYDTTQYSAHSVNASLLVEKAYNEVLGKEPSEFLLSAIHCHMGQWSEKENRPFTNVDRCVHLADYMASRSFIDIPTVSQEYNEIIDDEPFDADEYFGTILD